MKVDNYLINTNPRTSTTVKVTASSEIRLEIEVTFLVYISDSVKDEGMNPVSYKDKVISFQVI